jgi:hypothetical protein
MCHAWSCLFFDPHPTTQQSNLGVQWRKATEWQTYLTRFPVVCLFVIVTHPHINPHTCTTISMRLMYLGSWMKVDYMHVSCQYGMMILNFFIWALTLSISLPGLRYMRLEWLLSGACHFLLWYEFHINWGPGNYQGRFTQGVKAILKPNPWCPLVEFLKSAPRPLH